MKEKRLTEMQTKKREDNTKEENQIEGDNIKDTTNAKTRTSLCLRRSTEQTQLQEGNIISNKQTNNQKEKSLEFNRRNNWCRVLIEEEDKENTSKTIENAAALT